MSAAGVFILISNDGKADRLINGSDILEHQITKFTKQNEELILQGGGTITPSKRLPTVKQIEETHLIPFQAKFKPPVPLAMEYQKVVAGSSVSSFGQVLQFSLPQFGDFLTDMVVHISISQCSASPAPLPPDVAPNVYTPVYAAGQSNLAITLDESGTVLNTIDSVNQTVSTVTSLGYFNVNGHKVPGLTPVQDNVSYCEYPGERMMAKVSFEINGNVLDEYDDYSHVFERLFEIKKDKLEGYCRCVGQELPYTAKSDVMDNGVRVSGQLLSGLQTPQQVQPSWQVWQKLMFWFNKEQSVALPSAAIPYGQRYIKIQLADQSKLVFNSASVYQVLKVESRYIANRAPAFVPNGSGQYDLSSADSSSPGIVGNTYTSYYQIPITTNGAINYPTITTAELYVNNLFTHPTIHDMYVQNIGFSLIRIHKLQRQTVNSADMKILLNQFKFPIEYMYIGVIPKENNSGFNQTTDWWRFSKETHTKTTGGLQLDGSVGMMFNQLRLNYSTSTRTVDSLTVSAHGLNLYQKLDQQFYNQYLPLVFGKNTLNTPVDSGVMLVTFALNPGSYQPSGHFNVSRAREFYLDLSSSIVGSPNPSTQLIQQADIMTQGCAINFLLVSDGSAVLRYST